MSQESYGADDWERRSEEAQDMAGRIPDPETRGMLLRIAAAYARMATRARALETAAAQTARSGVRDLATAGQNR